MSRDTSHVLPKSDMVGFDDYLKSKRTSFLNALKCKTGLILAKAAAMRINANVEPAFLAPPSAKRLSARRQMSFLCHMIL